MTMQFDHLQLAIPAGGEDRARRFWGDLMGFVEEPKPGPLVARGGCWFRKGDFRLHLGVDAPFQPQRKAHPAFVVADLDDLAARLEAAGHPVKWDHALPDRRRFYASDPFGNRLEFIHAGDGFAER